MAPKEAWKPTPDGCYSVSSCGRVKRIKPGMRATVGRVLKPQFDGRYYHVRLGLGKLGIKMRTVHSLVAEAFLGERPCGCQVNHKDGNKRNNYADNLEYVTQKENMKHAASMGLKPFGENNGQSKMSNEDVIDVRERLKTGESCASIAVDFGVSSTAIHWIKTGRNWAKVS